MLKSLRFIHEKLYAKCNSSSKRPITLTTVQFILIPQFEPFLHYTKDAEIWTMNKNVDLSPKIYVLSLHAFFLLFH